LKQDYRQLLKPEVINSISGLALIARVVVDGHLSGLNQSRRLGSGMEFSQYRGYEIGEDLRLLDWKMLARSGRYYIKQSEIDSHISVKFILDASNSMQHEEEGMTKMNFVRVLTASLAWLAQSQGDAVGLFALNENKLHALQARVQKKHFNRLLLELISIETEGKWPQNADAFEKLHDRSQKELIFFISDLYEDSSEITKVISKLKTSRNEVVVLHVLGENELNFNLKGSLTFEDLETGAQLEIDAEKAKAQYLESFQNSIQTTKEQLLAKGISYQLLKMQEPLGEALQLLLKKRHNLL
jgi:uncharacterized protein (DUF58 family)